jgi:hypothetical protein
VDEFLAFLRERLDEHEIPDWHERTCQTHQKMPDNSPLGLAGSPMSCNCKVIDYVMADVAAKRRIIDEHSVPWTATDAGTICSVCCRGWPCKTLRLLALPYAGEPGYQEAWKL